MVTIKGEVNSADVYASIVDDTTKEQIKRICDQPAFADSKIKIMADCHAGAGRILGRKQAKETLTVSEFKKQMKDIYSSTVNASTLDESPMAYKPIDAILENIGDTVTVYKNIKPIYNFKAGDED